MQTHSSDTVLRVSINLRRLMARHDLTLTQVADRSGLDRRTVRGVLAGTKKPHSRTLHKLAVGLGVTADEFFLSPSFLVRGQFDREINPAVAEIISEHPGLFEGWTADDFDELYSRVGSGGALTHEEALSAVRAMNSNRELHGRLRLLIATGHADLVRVILEALYGNALSVGH